MQNSKEGLQERDVDYGLDRRVESPLGYKEIGVDIFEKSMVLTLDLVQKLDI
jgi:hypothetical protein